MPEIIIQAREARISEYLSVKRILPFRQRRMVGPFVFMDHAGQVYGVTSDVKTLSPLFYAHLKLAQNAKLSLPTGYTERALYVAKGMIEVKGQSYSKGQLIVFSKTDNPDIIATEETECMLLGGEPLGQRFIWWNFVSSRKERIEQAKHDWKNGNIILPPNDQNEFIPLPEI